MARNPVIVFCAHSDDQILGAGGTMAKYASEGKDVYTIIFTYGESSHFWLKRRISTEMRIKESEDADKVIGGKSVMFLGLSEAKLADEIKEKKIKQKIVTLINKIKPKKIFTHSEDDPHPNHKDVHKAVMEAIDSMKYNCDVYSFNIWSPVRTKKRANPKLVVDISNTFKLKIKALGCFKSQWASMFLLFWLVYASAIIYGIKNDVRYAEVFVKER